MMAENTLTNLLIWGSLGALFIILGALLVVLITAFKPK